MFGVFKEQQEMSRESRPGPGEEGKVTKVSRGQQGLAGRGKGCFYSRCDREFRGFWAEEWQNFSDFLKKITLALLRRIYCREVRERQKDQLVSCCFKAGERLWWLGPRGQRWEWWEKIKFWIFFWGLEVRKKEKLRMRLHFLVWARGWMTDSEKESNFDVLG